MYEDDVETSQQSRFWPQADDSDDGQILIPVHEMHDFGSRYTSDCKQVLRLLGHHTVKSKICIDMPIEELDQHSRDLRNVQ